MSSVLLFSFFSPLSFPFPNPSLLSFFSLLKSILLNCVLTTVIAYTLSLRKKKPHTHTQKSQYFIEAHFLPLVLAEVLSWLIQTISQQGECFTYGSQSSNISEINGCHQASLHLQTHRALVKQRHTHTTTASLAYSKDNLYLLSSL